MKRLILILMTSFLGCLALNAINYKDARREAWFLTDKMAYELNLTPEQCDVVYQINLDYFLSIRHASDCRGPYWRFRNEDLGYVLSSWQYQLFIALDYFYYPVRWLKSSWYYPVCRHYHSGYYYFERPVIYVSYHGCSWNHRSHHAVSPYRNRHFRSGVGLRDRYNGHYSNAVYHPGSSSDHHYTRPVRDLTGSGHSTNNSGYRPISHDKDNSGYRPITHDRNNSGYRPITHDKDNSGYRPSTQERNNSSRVNSGNRNDSHYRPSREYIKGRDANTESRRVTRDKSSSSSSRPQTHERKTREFGR